MLEISDIEVSFGALKAVDRVSAAVSPGEIVGVIGPNGSGKSTFLNALTGVVPARGSMTVASARVPLGRPMRARAAGIVRCYQTPQTFSALTCLENVLLATPDRRLRGLAAACVLRRGMGRHERARWADAAAVLERVGLRGLSDRPAKALAFGQQRMLEIARGIAARPAFLLLDEPSAGLNDKETVVLADFLESVRAQGIGILLVDHKVDFIDRLCSRIVVLELGQVIAEGPLAEVWQDARVIDAYLGRASSA